MGSRACRLLRSLPHALTLFLFSTLGWTVGTKAISLRGVAPSRTPEYQNRSTFTCTSDQKEIDITRVNDDVCDCDDGSDEPGTSACANGVFHCRNQGFKPRNLPSTFVDDGVCDCCDGSDEKQGCNDSCEALGKLALSETQAKLDRYVDGARARDNLLKEAHLKLAGWKQRSQELEETVGQLKPVVAQLHDEMKEAQRLQREAEEADKAGHSDTSTDHSEQHEVPKDPVAAVSTYEQNVADGDSDVHDPDAEAKRIASQWTSDPAAAGDADHAEATHDQDDEEESEATLLDEPGPDTDQPKTTLQRLVDTAVQNHTSKKHELRTAETELKTLYANLARDYGPGNVYAALYDVCLEMPKDQYKYRICGFGKALQIEGSSEVSLGKFNRCEDGCSRMFYTQGQTCWQGPPRSVQVILQCGPRHEIVSVEEPERCVYIAVVNTPAECTETFVQGFHEDLKQYNEASQADVKDEL